MKSLALAILAGTLIAECANACCGMTAPHTHTAPSPSVPTPPLSVPGKGAVDSAVQDAREAADVKAKIRAKNPDATDEQVEAGTKKVINERRRREREAESSGDEKPHITRSEAREKYRKAIEKNKDLAREKGISDDDLKKRVKAAILKKYAIDDDPTPPAPSETVASVEPPAVSPPQDPPAPKERTKIISLQELEAIRARLDAKNKREAEAKQQQAAYDQSRAYDVAIDKWKDRRSQWLPDNSWGMASEYNARKIKEYARETGGVNLEQIWEDQERAKFTGETLISRATPPPPKAVYQPQSPYYKEDDPRPQPPANYVPRRP